MQNCKKNLCEVIVNQSSLLDLFQGIGIMLEGVQEENNVGYLIYNSISASIAALAELSGKELTDELSNDVDKMICDCDGSLAVQRLMEYFT